jgi:hypothetical protein
MSDLHEILKLIDVGIGAPWQSVVLIFGCFLIMVGLLGRFWQRTERFFRPNAAVVVGIAVFILGFWANLAHDSISNGLKFLDGNVTNTKVSSEGSYADRQVAGKIITVHSVSGGGMFVLLKVDPNFRPDKL